ncbi:hypothetical protein C8Q72DRAFT_856805 [Fomitopsis betulina]|nr:hypothetical protein C8Q72DRAFT_856805 [Fomitopsis betulina]
MVSLLAAPNTCMLTWSATCMSTSHLGDIMTRQFVESKGTHDVFGTVLLEAHFILSPVSVLCSNMRSMQLRSLARRTRPGSGS